MSARRAIRVAAQVVCIVDGHILLTHQGAPGPARGKWTLPGGGVDFGEDLSSAAMRECFEETGLQPTLGRILGTYSSVYLAPGTAVETHGIRVFYEGWFQGPTRPEPTCPQGGEIDDVGWFPIDGLPAPATESVHLAVEFVS